MKFLQFEIYEHKTTGAIPNNIYNNIAEIHLTREKKYARILLLYKT